MSEEIRVKVKKVYSRNSFFIKILHDWLKTAESAETRRIMKVALTNITKYPFHLKDYGELKQVSGIGNVLATRLDKAYRDIQTILGEEPSIKFIQELKSGEILELLNSTKKIGTSDKNTMKSGLSIKKTSSKTSKTTLPQHFDNFNICSQNDESNLYNNMKITSEICESKKITAINDDVCMNLNSQIINSEENDLINENNLETSICFADPTTEGGQVILVCDIREQHGMNKHKTVVDHLIKDNVQIELMPLSVGDFIWIWRTPTKEIVLDYVIERKTWDDLKHSIRSKRLEDQKGRLKQSGIKNIVLLVEGKDTPDFSLEQSLCSFNVIHKFFIQRTESAADTATFLKVTTERFKARSKNEIFSGPDFKRYQDKNKKSVSESVRQVFAKQLTVCPQMSIEKALIITQKFPNMKSLWDLYINNNKKSVTERVDPKLLLNKEISQIPPSLSAQVSLFFNYSTYTN
ncbi:Crossover junction endonuclease MUS81 [Strongyloides ratti]|uniref:Crossover junction endonuclease MUS81 n=1 Tax=Strongyloides ratti TaxID=34506 RepID=A0A090MY01_STRRB|nr:Crossover junction endonuclease MUS81 [Strongyloides ratti]CEF66324.1 Crossover junction endonuclease MUS81 [Strongyloides ratti]